LEIDEKKKENQLRTTTMTLEQETKEPEISTGTYYSAIPIEHVGPNNPEVPIPPGHSRFYCKQCQKKCDLPDEATTWKCPDCHSFNTTTVPAECVIVCCTIQ